MRIALHRPTSLSCCSTVQVLLGMVLSVFLLLPSQPALAADLDIEALSKTVTDVERTLARKRYDVKTLKELVNQVAEVKSKAGTCVADFEIQQTEVQAALTSLGEATAKDPIDVTRKRRDIQKQLTDIDKQLGSCRVLVIQSEELHIKLNDAIKELLASRMLVRGPDFITLLRENWNKPSEWFSASETFTNNHGGLDLMQAWQWLVLIILLVLTIGPAILLRQYLEHRIRRKHWSDDFSSGFICAIVASLAHYAPHLIGSTAVAIFFSILTREIHPPPFITVITQGLPLYFLILLIITMLLAPPAPATRFLTLPEDLTRALARRLRVLALLAYVGYLLFSTLLKHSLPEAVFLIARDVYASFLILNFIWAFGLMMRLSSQPSVRWMTGLVHLSLLIALVAEWMGYRNLGFGLARGVLGSLIVIGSTLLLSRLFHDLFNNLDYGRHNWSRRLREAMGLKPGDKMPGLFWLRLFTVVTLWLLFGYFMLQVWDVSDTILFELYTYLTQGFTIWSLEIVPARFASAIITIAVILTIGGWFRKRMESSWLKHTHLDRGAREATVTITGYIVVTIAIITGLSVAGFNFQSIAIIAGALSLGIGFGLQNIVNNFISGLILLFERPIKTGDWIAVGNTEGYVKRIRIRSTEIQTFDRADVIVPNSELISSQVTNWMLHDTRGRARIPVGVAYGTNTQKVKEILEKVATDHPSVVNDGSSPNPKVLFRGFGDSSLDFELRCHIKDIDERLGVISDLNFAIDAAFRENGIVIPFPQRDVHMHKLPDKNTPLPPDEKE